MKDFVIITYVAIFMTFLIFGIVGYFKALSTLNDLGHDSSMISRYQTKIADDTRRNPIKTIDKSAITALRIAVAEGNFSRVTEHRRTYTTRQRKRMEVGVFRMLPSH